MKLARIGRIFPKSTSEDTVQTMMELRASPREVWDAMLFYEEIPQRPNALLRLVLPVPVRTRGEKTTEGSLIECTYDGGSLEKRITSVDVARSVRFDVCEQELGVEDCI